MRYRRTRAVGVAAIVLAFLASIVVFPELPSQLAIHWGASGEVDNTMSRLVGAFILPALAAGVYALLLVSPRLNPRQNIESFRGLYEWFAAGMTWFLLYVHVLVLLWNLGIQPPIGAVLAPALAAVFYATGFLLERAKPNWIVGIRTPWTLEDDDVWEQTHHRAASAFKLAGIIALGGLVFPEAIAAFTIVPMLLAAAYAIVYSFVAYRHQHTT